MAGVRDDVTRFDFDEKDGGLVWTLTRESVIAGRPWRSWASGRVVAVTEEHVDLSGTYDRSEPARLEGAAVTATLRRTPQGLEGHIRGYDQRMFPVILRRRSD